MSSFNTPAEIAVDMCSVSKKKATGTLRSLVVLGVLAGVYIGFASYLSALVMSDLSEYLGIGLTKLIGGSVFSIGLMLVVIAGAELFTGNSLMVVGLLTKQISGSQLLRNWLIVYFANFCGSLLLVGLLFLSGLWQADGVLVGAKLVTIATVKVELTFLEALSRGILCNWLVCLAVWMAMASKDVIGKLGAIFFPVMMFVASGFEHSIANQFFIPMGIMLKEQAAVQAVLPADLNVINLTWEGFITANLVPVTLGNIIGGGIFVATLYWYVYLAPAQAKARNSSISKGEKHKTVHDEETA